MGIFRRSEGLSRRILRDETPPFQTHVQRNCICDKRCVTKTYASNARVSGRALFVLKYLRLRYSKNR